MDLPLGAAHTRVTSTSSQKERADLLRDIRSVVSSLGVSIEVTPYSPRHDVLTLSAAELRADVDIDAADGATPSMIHWHGAGRPLVPVPGAWSANEINTAHRRKATSYPPTFQALLGILACGFAAANDGSAFQEL
ncbi:hypothetical protein ETR14_27070 (plasmid) [Sphingosinicella sp. BN140058]|nr:hypothetical protein ETR14_27070 [Sphingosinicella sp. BN140058]